MGRGGREGRRELWGEGGERGKERVVGRGGIEREGETVCAKRERGMESVREEGGRRGRRQRGDI